MRPLTLEDVTPLAAYEGVRPRLREAVIAHKARRRVAVGERVTLVFEDRETLRWQVLEMCRVEGLRDPAAVRHELEVYNELMPGEGELSATLFVEITDQSDIRKELDRLIGMDEHVALLLDDQVVPARFDAKQMDEDRISAVQYVRFPLTPAQIARFDDPTTRVALRLDHPHYRAEATLSLPARRALSVDLHGEPEPLVDLRAATAAPPRAPEALRRRGRAEARPAEPARAPGHVVVELPGAAVGVLDLPADALSELLGLARDVARDVQRQHGRCRISADVEAVPPRLDVYAPPGRR